MLAPPVRPRAFLTVFLTASVVLPVWTGNAGAGTQDGAKLALTVLPPNPSDPGCVENLMVRSTRSDMPCSEYSTAGRVAEGYDILLVADHTVAAGVYFYRLQTEDTAITKRMYRFR